MENFKKMEDLIRNIPRYRDLVVREVATYKSIGDQERVDFLEYKLKQAGYEIRSDA